MPAKPLHLRHHQSPQQPIVPGLHRPSTPPGYPPASARRDGSKLSFGTVCSSNINRSMEAHVVLSNAGERDNIVYYFYLLMFYGRLLTPHIYFNRYESRVVRHRNTSPSSWQISNGAAYLQIWHSVCRNVQIFIGYTGG
jgi:hypothetical protein